MNNTAALTLFSSPLSTDSLGGYIHWVNQIPLLEEAEELSLAQDLQKNQNLEAARKLILSHLRFVVKIARNYAGYGLQQADLIQEGNIGLMKAVKRFDPAVGVRLASFAIHWIRAEIHEFIIRNWRIVKIATTKAQRKLFFNLRKATKKRDWLSREETTQVAEQLNVSEEDVRQMEMRMTSHDQSLETSHDEDEDSAWQAPIHFLEDKAANPEQSLLSNDFDSQQSSQLHRIIATLDERSQLILQKRWFADEKATLQELAAQLNISLERVRQIEKNAMMKIRSAMEA